MVEVEHKVVGLSDIKVNPNNPRYIQDEQYDKLKQSISSFPDMLKARPIAVDENMVILGGNMRYRVLKDMNIKDIPIMVLTGLTEAQKREFIIKDNLAFGEWDWDILANHWEQEELEEWGMKNDYWESEGEPEDIDFDDIEDTSDREKTFKTMSVVCPNCEHSFLMQT